MKKLLVILMLMCGSAFSQTNLLTWEISLSTPEYVLITGLSEDGWIHNSTITIPSAIEGYPVTAIRYRAFSGSAATGFVLPSTLTEIGDSAFSSCMSLTEPLTIPEGVLWIPDRCFQETGSLAIIILPSALISIGVEAFGCCSMLGGLGAGTFTLPESVLTIGACAFTGCVGLHDLNIPSGVSVINAATFDSCGFYDIYFSEGLQTIMDTAFIYSALTNVSFPASLETIGSYAFDQCSGFGGANLDLKSVSSVGASAFTYCGFTNAVLTNLTTISSLLFAYCVDLKTVTLSPRLERIESQAFGQCNLSALTLPATLNYFDVSSLEDMYGMQTLTFLGDMPETVGEFDEYTAPFANIYIQPQANGWINPLANRTINNWYWIPATLIKGE